MNFTSSFSLKRPRFTLRTLFVVVTIFACWLGYQLNWIRQQHAAATNPLVEVNGYENFMDYESNDAVGTVAVFWPSVPPNHGAPRSLRLFGEKGHILVYVDMPESTRDFQRIRKLFPEAMVKVMPKPYRRERVGDGHN